MTVGADVRVVEAAGVPTKAANPIAADDARATRRVPVRRFMLPPASAASPIAPVSTGTAYSDAPAPMTIIIRTRPLGLDVADAIVERWGAQDFSVSNSRESSIFALLHAPLLPIIHACDWRPRG